MITIVDLVPLPFIITGDSNADLDRFDCWPSLESKGCRCLPQMYRRLVGSSMPATCKDVTIPHNAIISLTWVPFLAKVRVLKVTGIPTHHPVLFDLTFPVQGIFRHRINFPRQYTELGLNESDFEKAFNQAHESLPQPNTIQEWGTNLDTLADFAIKKRGIQALPVSFSGRCQKKRVTKCPVQSSTKIACNGVYEPSTEVLTMATRRKIAQLGRIQSLMRRLFKLQGIVGIPATTVNESNQEWHAICKSKAMGKLFLFWLRDFPETPLPAFPIPTAEWLHDVSQLVQYEVDSNLQLDKKYFQDCLRSQRHVDKKFASSKQSFKQVHGNAKPPLTEIKEVIQDFVKVIPLDEPHNFEIYGEFTRRLSCQFPVMLGDFFARVLSVEDDAAIVDLGDAIWPGYEDTHITQHFFSCDSCDPREIANQLNAFWLPIWRQDAVMDDLEQEFPDLQSITQHFRCILPFRLT